MEQQTLLLDAKANPWNGYQSRYVAYCKAHGAGSPEEMLARDEVEYPGGKMGEYIRWIGAKWRDWRDLTQYPGPLMKEHHEAFDAWLARNEPDPTPTTKEK